MESPLHIYRLGTTVLQLLALHALAAIVAPALLKALGRKAFLVLAVVPGSAAVWAAAQSAAVAAGQYPAVTVTWVPSLNLHLSFRLDTLSWLMTMIVGGVGALVLIYCAAYFSSSAKSLGRFAGVFVAFAGAMLGLVTTDNSLMLYVFWELTTITSYLLIGHYYERQASRRAAFQAIIITTMGGLAMLAGLIALGQMPGGSYSLSALVQSASEGNLGVAPDGVVFSTLLNVSIVLVLLGAITKSALIPFHFWLPAAMAAPTPVSAYLHAAAMVKGGVYLVARLAPGFSTEPVWQWTTVVLGLATMLIGGYRALRQYDLKLLLAFGTVSQLGMLIVLVGYPSKAVALAGLTALLAHAMFKACLFLVVGEIDWAAGTRDMRELSNLRRSMPVLAVAAAIAIASMAGIPPLLGYVAKEAALDGFFHAQDWAVLGVFALGAVLTVAYGLRFWMGAFGSYGGVPDTEVKRRSALIQFSPVVLALGTLVLGLIPGPVERALAPHADLYPGEPGHLTLWGGFTVPLAITAVVLVLGVGLYLKRRTVTKVQEFMAELPGASDVYRLSIRGLENLAADVTAVTQRGSLPAYLALILGVLIVTEGIAIVTSGSFPETVVWANSGIQVAIVVFIGIASILAARARRRLKAVILLGASGYGMAMLFATYGAPDLALTQVMVETVTLVLFVLVLRRLPTYFSNRPMTADRYLRMIVGAGTGLVVGLLGVIAISGRVAEPISLVLPEATYEYGYGRNIVNVILVDTRAWDTMGEISVLMVAATGVASLLFVRNRTGIVDSQRNLLTSAPRGRVWDDGYDISATLRRTGVADEAPKGRRNQTWLRGGRTLSPQRRSLIFEIGTRLIFHSMLLLSLYLLLSGHNQPGGGFSGGLVAGTALIVRYLAGGRYELGEAMPLHAGYLLGAGVATAGLSALLPLFFGGAVLQTVVFDFTVPIWGDVHLATALLFDVGVYVLVLGLVLDILRSFGAEIDRHGEVEGLEPADDEDDAEVDAR